MMNLKLLRSFKIFSLQLGFKLNTQSRPSKKKKKKLLISFSKVRPDTPEGDDRIKEIEAEKNFTVVEDFLKR